MNVDPPANGSLNQSDRLDRRALVVPSNRAAREDAIWPLVETRLEARSAQRRAGRLVRASLLATGACALALGAWGVLRATTPTPEALALDDGTRVLADGSRVLTEAGAAVAFEEVTATAVTITLGRGRAWFEVAPNARRRFVVKAGAVRVTALGTRFSVERSADEHIDVSVEHGRVEIRDGARSVVLGQGERWPAGASARHEPAQAVEVGTEDFAGDSDAPEGRSKGTAGPRRAAPPSAPRPAAGHATTEGPAGRADGFGPADLFEAAAVARLGGRVNEAAALYALFLHRFPRDGRASLVAFELGCARMDVLGDAAGAIAALDRALALSPASPFREDALARLVRAHEARGDRSRCQATRARYLTEHPRGRHAAEVERRCTP